MIDKHAMNIAIHALSDAELDREADQMREKSRTCQSMSSKLQREKKRRARKRREHVSV